MRLMAKCWAAGLGGLLLLLLFPKASLAEPRFYLSTERVYSPEEKEIHVRLEANGLSHVDFRVYRVPDPEKFFLLQKELHRVETQNGPKRVNSLDVLHEVWRASLDSTIEWVRGAFTKESRATTKTAIPDAFESVRDGAAAEVTPAPSVPLLAGFELVDLWREDIPQGGPQWSYLDVGINAREPGVYLVEGVHGREVGYTVIVLSGVVLLTRQSESQLLVYAVDPLLGTPVPEVALTARKGDQVLAKGTTDDNGLWLKEIPLSRQLTIFGTRGRDFALLDPSYHPANLIRHKLYLATERPVYRPGQEVFFKGVLRGFKDERYLIDPEIHATKVRVEDPNGQEVYSAEIPVRASGTFDGRFKLPENANLGTYRLLASAGGKEHGGEFKVKAYRKPEYEVSVSTPRHSYVSGEQVEAKVEARYFFGPPVPEARVKVSVYRTRFYVPWWTDADYSWYYSDAEYQNTTRETIEEKEGRLDANGHFAVSFKTAPESQDWTYGIEAVVTDAADQSVTGSATVRVTRGKLRLTLLPEHLLFSPGQEAQIKLGSSDYDKNPLPAEVQVTITARRGSDPAKAKSEEVLRTTVATGAKGEANVAFTPKNGGTYTVTATARDESGHQIQETALVYVTSEGGDIPYAPSDIEIIPDRRSYYVGDKARFLLLVPHADAHLLVTVEGGRIYRHEVVRAHGTSALFEMPIEEGQAPNFFVSAATVFDRALYERRLDVVVPPRAQLLNVAVSANKPEVKPGESVDFTVKVTDHKGGPVSGAEVALAVVDEAIYSISPEIAVPISHFFYHRKRNNVRSDCSLGFRFYGYGEEAKDRMAARRLRPPVLPGSFKSLASGQVRKDFRDTLAWIPAQATDKDGMATVNLKVPDNLTTWRATARAITSDTRVGQGAGKMRVSKPVVVRLAAPSFLVEKDQATIGVVVHNTTAQAHSFAVTIEQGGENLKLKARQGKLDLAAGQMGVWSTQVEAVGAGEAVLRLAAKAGDLGDAMESRLPVRRYGMEQVLAAAGMIDDAHPSGETELVVPEASAPGSARLDVSVSTGVAPALLASLEYLAGYPYGCTEQTMSRFLPDLLVAQALKDLGMKNPPLEEKLPEYVHGGLARLAQLQHTDGGWGWWAEDATDPMMTAYVIQGLALAKRLTWKVEENMLQRGTERLKDLLTETSLNSNQRSYLLYSLALAGVKYESMLEKLQHEGDLSAYGRALLALALFELGQRDAAQAALGPIDQAVYTSPSGAHWGSDAPGWEQDAVESTSAVLRALLQIKPGSVNLAAAVQWLMSMREQDHWKSTRDTAMAVFALVDYFKKYGGAEYDATLKAILNGQPAGERAFGKKDVFAASVPMIAARPVGTGSSHLSLSRTGKGVWFYNAAVTYFGREEQIQAHGEVLKVQRKLLRLRKESSGEGFSFNAEPLSGAVHPGDEVLVVLDLEATRDLDYLMVEDPLPAGAAPIEQDHGYNIPGVKLQQPYLHREFSDQHASFFLSHLRKGRRTLAYLVRATLPGSYHVLPARLLPMYDPKLAGNSAGDLLQVEE